MSMPLWIIWATAEKGTGKEVERVAKGNGIGQRGLERLKGLNCEKAWEG
jgi:hypothetical protein